MLNLVFGAGGASTCTVPPVTNLRIELRASRQLISELSALNPYFCLISLIFFVLETC